MAEPVPSMKEDKVEVSPPAQDSPPANPDKIVWGQGIVEGKEEYAVFTLAGYLKSHSRLVAEAFCTKTKVELPSVDLSPLDFRAALFALRGQNLAEGEKTLALRDKLTTIPLGSWIEEFEAKQEKGLKAKGEKTLQQQMLSLFPESNIQVMLSVIDEAEYTSWQQQKSQAKEGGNGEAVSQGNTAQEITLNVQVAIDPAQGKPLSELHQGETLIVRIADSSPLAQYLSTLIATAQGNKEETLLAKAQEAIQLPSGRYKLIVRFGPGILGECVLLDQVKVKVPREAEEQEELPRIFNIPVKISPYWIGEIILLILIFSFFILARLIL